jgi:hypothetical protein
MKTPWSCSRIFRGLDPEVFRRSITVRFQGDTLRMIGREDASR